MKKYIVLSIIAILLISPSCTQKGTTQIIPESEMVVGIIDESVPTFTPTPLPSHTPTITSTPTSTNTPMPEATPNQVATETPTPEILSIDDLFLAQEAVPNTVSLDNGIGVDQNGYIVSKFDRETQSWIAVEVHNYKEALEAISHPVPFVDEEGNEVTSDRIQIYATNNNPPGHIEGWLVSPIPFGYGEPLANEDGSLLSPQQTLEKALWGLIELNLSLGRKINASEISDPDIFPLYATNINTVETIINPDGTVKRLLVNKSDVEIKIIYDVGNGSQLNLPTAQIEGQSNQDDQAYLDFPYKAGSGRIRFGIYIDSETFDSEPIIYIISRIPESDLGKAGALIYGNLWYGVLCGSVVAEPYQQRMLIEDRGKINMTGISVLVGDDLEASYEAQRFIMNYMFPISDSFVRPPRSQ